MVEISFKSALNELDEVHLSRINVSLCCTIGWFTTHTFLLVIGLIEATYKILT